VTSSSRMPPCSRRRAWFRVVTDRDRRPVGSRMVTAIAVIVGVVFAGGLTVSVPSASAGTTVTYTSLVTVPAPPSSNFAGAAGGGDGWAVALTATQLFNVFHHNPRALIINCHNQADATSCWLSPKTITDAGGGGFSTSGQPGLTVDQTSGHLFVFATRLSDFTAGVVCIDTTQPAGNPNPFCGFTALSAVGDAPLDSGISGVTDPVVVGSKWYAFNEVPGIATGTKDKVLCFDLGSHAACANQPYALGFGAGSVSSRFPAPGIAGVGVDLMVQVPTASGTVLTCFDTTSDVTCGGTWPVPVVSTSGAPYPLLSAAGSPTGICLPTGPDPCYDLSGASVLTPTGMAAAIQLNSPWDGPAVTFGARVYVPNGNRRPSHVNCYDYITAATCANFPLAVPNLNLLYTVNADPQRPTCMWVNADGGTSQIQNFDAFTAGSCGTAPTRVAAPPTNACLPSAWTSLKVLSPVRSGYTSGTVDFQDADGNAIPGVTTHNLDAAGTADLTDLNLASQYRLPEFVLAFAGLTGPPGTVQVQLTWTGTYLASCVSSTITVVNATVPGPPMGLSLTGATGVFTVSWTAPGSDGFSPITGYTVTAYDSGNHAVGTCTSPPSVTSCVVTGLTGNNVYTFKVVATNDLGSSLPASIQNQITGGAVPVPTAGATAATPGGLGYWALASAEGSSEDGRSAALLPATARATAGGTLTNHGNAGNYGSENGVSLAAPVVAINSTSTGKGYWLAATDGGVFSFGDARFYGSMANRTLNQPIAAIVRTPDDGGYWLVAADGGVFSFGDARFYGSVAGVHLNQPVVAAARTADGRGYWLLGADGGVFALGDAQFYGSMGAINLNKNTEGIVSPSDGFGYWIVAGDGGVFAYGDAAFHGSLAANGTIAIVGLIANGAAGYRLISPEGAAYSYGTNP
jgi:hypothetical protein